MNKRFAWGWVNFLIWPLKVIPCILYQKQGISKARGVCVLTVSQKLWHNFPAVYRNTGMNGIMFETLSIKNMD